MPTPEEETEKIQKRIDDLKNEETDKDETKTCPLMSYRAAAYERIKCEKGDCALWNSYYCMCSFKVKKNN